MFGSNPHDPDTNANPKMKEQMRYNATTEQIAAVKEAVRTVEKLLAESDAWKAKVEKERQELAALENAVASTPAASTHVPALSASKSSL